jgi:hypothetical protein
MTVRNKLTKENLKDLRQMLEKGCGYTQCAEYFNNVVSKQRIKQIAEKWGIDSMRIRQKKMEEVKQKEMIKKWGPKWDDYEWRKSDIYKAMREKFRSKKANAKSRGIEFTVPFGELEFPQVCPVLGLTINYFAEGERLENSPSFDRIDASKGYVSGNVIIVSWRANRIKNDGTPEEHLKIAQFYSR